MPSHLPCENCILLAACKHRYEVRCELLHNEANTIASDDISINKWWQLVNKWLPVVHTIKNDMGKL